MTYSIALLSIPASLFWEIVETLEEMGVAQTYLTKVPGSPLPTTAIDMNGLALVINREDDRDILTSSDSLVELVDAVAKDAFAAGHAASLDREVPPEDAWQRYQPSPAIREKLNSFYKEHAE